MKGQAIRPSQFVLTYGVGTVIDTKEGPRMILEIKKWGRMFTHPNTSKPLSVFEIEDDNLTVLLRGKIFAIPTNADLEKPEDEILYLTGLFPRWAKCEEHKILYPLTRMGLSRCPNCRSDKYAQTEAIRFVRACQDGHLDDIDWPSIIHRKNKTCNGVHFTWIEGAGGDLRDVKISCPKCKEEATLWDIYRETWSCSGYHPETGEFEKCDKEAVVVLRSASNLRIPEVVSALTIPPKSTPLHRVLRRPAIQAVLALTPNIDKQQLVSALATIARSNPLLVDHVALDAITNADESEIKSAINDNCQPIDPDLTPKTLKEKEFDALRYAALNGYPPDPKKPDDFEVDKHAVTTLHFSSRLSIRITPVKKLRIVIAQKGFRRFVRPKSVPVEKFTPKLVETFYSDGTDRWFPGVELRGEGIFIDLPPAECINLDEEASAAWFKEFKALGMYYGYHPVFVFWHTLAHRVIQALGLDSGYSSASIRERIYLNLGKDPTHANGGFLVYTSQPGGDGSLGGLIALASEFGSVMSTALRNINTCSNDPLCSEQILTRGRANGAACYACLFLSETSCEYRNLFLDRNLLRRSI
jgi:hypothetical protein